MPHCPVGWHHHVPRYCRSYAEGNHRPGPVNPQDQDHCPAGAQVLRLDRWFDLGLSVHLPTDVDLETGIRRIWPGHRSPQVLLNQHQQQLKPNNNSNLIYLLIKISQMQCVTVLLLLITIECTLFFPKIGCCHSI